MLFPHFEPYALVGVDRQLFKKVLISKLTMSNDLLERVLLEHLVRGIC
jgi:hypothetical protein